MVRALAVAVVFCFALVILSGCLAAPVIPPYGTVYSEFKAPLNPGQHGNQFGTKVGMASTGCVLGLVAWGDGSLRKAADDGKIRRVDNADYEYFNLLFIYQRYTTIVYGE